MSERLRFGLVDGPVKAKPIGMGVYGPAAGWCRHVHQRISESVFCQRERRAGINGLPPDPLAAVCQLYKDGRLGPLIGKSVLMASDGSAMRVRIESAEPYSSLLLRAGDKAASYVGWDRLHGPCGHQHPTELDAVNCAEEIRRRMFSGRLVFEGFCSALARYWSTPLLYHVDFGRPARDLHGRLLQQQDYPPVSDFHPKQGE